jgi:Exopolysaccharide biosynthesis protein YbjH
VEVSLAPAPRAAPGPGLLTELSAQTGWRAHALQRGPRTWTARFDDAGGVYVQDRLDRVWAVLHRDAPPEVQTLAVELAERQLPQVRHEVDRNAWARARLAQSWAPPGDHRADQALTATRRMSEPQATKTADDIALPTPRTRWGVNLGYQQHLGGPDGYLYALVGRASGQVRLWDGAWAQGTAQVNLIDNYDRFRYDAPSELPRVRTRIREYVRASGVTVPNLQINQAARLAEGVYGLAYAGWLESMFAGVGGEVLWRPLNSPVAVGVDINRVRQREPEQRAGLLPYRVTTGHVSAYWDTGWKDVVAQVSAGQYLAGDKGVTLDLSRVFANGTRLGLWATKTNVSAAQFGEGSFDKGVYLSIPFEALLTGWSSQTFAIAWQPLLRDGGARLRRGASLWTLTDMRDARAAAYRAPPPTAD